MSNKYKSEKATVIFQNIPSNADHHQHKNNPMSFFRKKKKTTEAESTQKSSTTSSTSSSSTKVDENNVRVFSSTETKTMDSMTTKPNLPTTLDEGETYEDAEVFDRRSLKATARRQVSVQQPTTTTTERMNKKDKVDKTEDDELQGDDENKPLRSGPRSYGNARENTEGFYNARITVKDWQFNVDSIIVPVGCMILFSVDKSERSMVEVNVQIHDVRKLFSTDYYRYSLILLNIHLTP